MYIFLILFVPIPPSFFFMQNQKSTDNPHQTQKHFHKDLRREQKFYDENQQNVNDAEEEAKQFCADLRRLQQRNKCSNSTCEDICSTFSKYLRTNRFTPQDFKAFDKQMKQDAGVSFLRLNGCPSCDNHIYMPDDRCSNCPKCGHARFDSNGQPFETFLYFPLKPRFHSLLQTQRYVEMIQHECTRPSNPNLMTDVYDSPEWQRLMGPATSPNDRMGVQACVDGIPANQEGSHSVKPGTLINFSLSPTERGKHENIMLFFVIPTSIKDPHVKKYFDWIAEYELDDLFENGKCFVNKQNFNFDPVLKLTTVIRCGRSQS